MKKVLPILCMLLSFHIMAQKAAVIVNSPSSLQGEKVFAGADFGTDLTSNLWTADLVMANPNLGCSPLTNSAEIAGKICVIDRGICLFDQKGQAAATAGAIALIILNHNDQTNRGGPPFQMAGSAAVSIPVVMLGYQDGIDIKEAMKSGTVNVTLGGFPKEDNDVSISKSQCDGALTQPNVIHPTYGSYLLSQLRGATDFNFLPGGMINNPGKLGQANAKLGCEISKGSTSLYKESVDITNIGPDETGRGILSKAFSDVSNGAGRYSISYSASIAQSEKYLSDNVYNTYFDLSGGIISKSRFNVNDRAPIFSGAYYFGGGASFREYMMPFSLPYGKGLMIDTLYSNILANAPLASAYLEGRIYRWDDSNNDNEINTEEMTLVALGSKTFDASETRTSAVLTIPLENLEGSELVYTVKNDGELHFASVQYSGGSQEIFMGYDHDYNQRMYVQAKDSAQTLEYIDYPYLNTATQAPSGGPDMDVAGLFYFDCNGSGANEDEVIYSPIDIAIHVSGMVATKDLNNKSMDVKILGNPVKEILTAEIQLQSAEKITYQVVNSLGNVIYQSTEKESTTTVLRSFDLQGIASGNYFLKVRSANAIITKPFIVIK
ncbi:MAG: T9SS type A sorting domain-containing protein [Saprospiraceae bacterium]|nr:T9SS type A sorting domain-containing protein [Saprospiraceae bacterium]